MCASTTAIHDPNSNSTFLHSKYYFKFQKQINFFQIFRVGFTVSIILLANNNIIIISYIIYSTSIFSSLCRSCFGLWSPCPSALSVPLLFSLFSAGGGSAFGFGFVRIGFTVFSKAYKQQAMRYYYH
mgnify:CR=1 FL=1